MSKLLAVSGLCFFPLLATAADLSGQPDWAGAYAGINLGYAWSVGDVKQTGSMATLVDGYSNAYDDNSTIGGIKLGYNWLVGSLILGAEATLNASNLESGKTQSNDYGFAQDRFHSTTNVDWSGSLKGRLGISPVNHLMIFTSAGLAVGYVENHSRFDVVYPGAPENNGTVKKSASETRLGWTSGLGAEYALSNQLATTLEYSYTDLGDETYGVNGSYWNGDPINYRVKSETKLSSLLLGLNYRF